MGLSTRPTRRCLYQDMTAMTQRRQRTPETEQTDRTPLTLSELCKELSISRSTFYAWRASRRAPLCIKLPNGEIRVRRSDLNSWLQSREDGDIP